MVIKAICDGCKKDIGLDRLGVNGGTTLTYTRFCDAGYAFIPKKMEYHLCWDCMRKVEAALCPPPRCRGGKE